jgi:hypothetical protein
VPKKTFKKCNRKGNKQKNRQDNRKKTDKKHWNSIYLDVGLAFDSSKTHAPPHLPLQPQWFQFVKSLSVIFSSAVNAYSKKLLVQLKLPRVLVLLYVGPDPNLMYAKHRWDSFVGRKWFSRVAYQLLLSSKCDKFLEEPIWFDKYEVPFQLKEPSYGQVQLVVQNNVFCLFIKGPCGCVIHLFPYPCRLQKQSFELKWFCSLRAWCCYTKRT